MRPEDLTIEMLEEAYGQPAEKWHGKCHNLAWAASRLLGIETKPPYGHYHGYVDPDGYWKGRTALNSHGWVLLEDGRILDPTRWSFENKEPYIYIGKNNGDYDEGGNKLRARLMRPRPEAKDGRKANLKHAESHHRLALETVLETSFEDITVEQLYWIGNLPFQHLDFFVTSVYEVLAMNDMKVIIPIDNWDMAVRERNLKDPTENAA